MLQKIRDNSSGPLAYAVVAVIVVVFGVWGIGSYLTPSPNTSIAEVNGSSISEAALRRAFNQRLQRLQRLMGDRFDAEQVSRDKLRRAALQGLIQERLVTDYARSAGYRITDGDVLAALRGQPAFQRNGQFSKQRYRQALARAGLKPAQYEAGLRQRLLSRAPRAQIQDHALSLPVAVDATYARDNQQRRVRYLSFDASAFRDQIQVSDADIRRYYNAHSGQYKRPRRVKLAYVMLDAGALPASKKPSQQRLEQLYKTQKSKLGTPEKRAAQMVRVPIGPDNAAGARQAIQSVSQQLADGTSLRQAAATVSSVAFDTIDATAQTEAPSAIAKPLFALALNKVSNPIHGDKAWYLVRPTRIEPAATPPLSDNAVRAKLERIAKRQSRRKRFQAKREKMADLAVQAPNGLQTLADNLALQVHKTDWLTRENGTGLASNAAVRQAAFSESVYQQGLNSDVIQLGEQRVAIVRVADRQAARQRPLSDVRDRVRRSVRAQKALRAARAAAREARQKLAAGETTMAALADERPATTLHKTIWVSRQSRTLGAAVRRSVFSLPPPDSEDNASYAVTPTTDDNVALIALLNVRQGGSSNKTQANRQRQKIAERQARYRGTLEYVAFTRYLRATGDVTVDKQALSGS